MNIVRFYNRNRKTIWLIIFVILFVLFIINALDNFYEVRSRRSDNSTSQQLNENKTYKNESQAMVQGQITSEKKQQEFGELMDEFLGYCNNNQVQEAYGLLSNNCREKLYPTQDAFYNEYYSKIFDSRKSYDFQLWSAIDKTYVYLVKIFEDMLSTGIAGSQNYIQEYISIVEEGSQYRVNVGGLVKNIEYDDSSEKNGIKIEVVESDEYMDYTIYHFKITNNTPKNILLGLIDDENSINVEDNQENEFQAGLMEQVENDLIVEANTTKDIEIRFNRSYSTQTEPRRINFNNIIKDYDAFNQDRQAYKDVVEIIVNL